MTRDSIDDLVVPEKRDEWPSVKAKWFADDTPRGQKTPGYLKEEFSSDSGKYIGLSRVALYFFGILICLKIIATHVSPKCYFINNGTSVKRSHKGTPKHVDLGFAQYEAALFQHQVAKVSFNRFMVDPRLGTVTTKNVEKLSVNPRYLKLHVTDDQVTVQPHVTKNGYLYYINVLIFSRMSTRVNTNVLPLEYFRPHEVKNLSKIFEHKKASLHDDFVDFELDVISNFGALKNQAHLYLGINKNALVKI